MQALLESLQELRLMIDIELAKRVLAIEDRIRRQIRSSGDAHV